MTTKTWYLGLRRGRKRLENFFMKRGDVTRAQTRVFIKRLATSKPFPTNAQAAMLLYPHLRG